MAGGVSAIDVSMQARRIFADSVVRGDATGQRLKRGFFIEGFPLSSELSSSLGSTVKRFLDSCRKRIDPTSIGIDARSGSGRKIYKRLIYKVIGKRVRWLYGRIGPTPRQQGGTRFGGFNGETTASKQPKAPHDKAKSEEGQA